MTGPSPDRCLTVAVVGHTNTGKTSLLRTLTRDAQFGEVSARPAVTRHVEGAALLVAGEPVISLFDTPGLEDSIGLLDVLDRLGDPRAEDHVDTIHRFLDSPDAQRQYSQEAKALRQVLDADAALYVIDARDRVLGKHRDELEILRRSARPIIPVLNFLADAEAQADMWREHLSRAGLHAVAAFDTVVFDAEGELRLYQTMLTLLDRWRPTLDAVIDDRRAQRAALIDASAGLVAEMLIDIASFVLIGHRDDDARAAVGSLQSAVRAREQQCVEALLDLHRFSADDCISEAIPLEDGRWGTDPFNPEALKTYGIRASGGAAAGALAGLAVDAMVGGITLGAAAATGAVLGAVFGGGHLPGKKLVDRLRGRVELRCDDAAIQLVGTRQIALVRALLIRGHAASTPVQIPDTGVDSLFGRSLPDAMRRARQQSKWSRMNEDRMGFDPFHPSRVRAMDDITSRLTAAMAV